MGPSQDARCFGLRFWADIGLITTTLSTLLAVDANDFPNGSKLVDVSVPRQFVSVSPEVLPSGVTAFETGALVATDRA
jgi:hypothetical protein